MHSAGSNQASQVLLDQLKITLEVSKQTITFNVRLRKIPLLDVRVLIIILFFALIFLVELRISLLSYSSSPYPQYFAISPRFRLPSTP